MRSPLPLLPVAIAAWALAAPLVAQAPGDTKPPKLSDLESRATRDSLDADAHYQLGMRYLEMKRWDAAARELKSSVEIDPHFARAYLALAYLPFFRTPDLRKHGDENNLSLQEKDTIAQSLRLERKAFLIDPLVDLIDLRAEALIGSQVHLTRNGYSLRLEYAPLETLPSRRVWFHGLAAAHSHDYQEAVRTFQILLNRETRREESDSVFHVPLRTNDYRYVLGVIYQEWGKPADAMEQYQAAITGDLGLYMAHTRLAHMYGEHQMWDKAIEELEIAVQAAPDDTDLLTDLGQAQQSSGQLAAAERTLHLATERNPRDPHIPYALAVVEMLNSHTADARREFTRFVAIAPSRMNVEIDDAKQRLATLPQ